MLDLARQKLHEADAILVGAGAGMGVDSGLPDFRGNEGFWKAYPPFKKLGLSFYDLANPQWFQNDPHRAWGFYGHRMNLYRHTDPHIGFSKLLEFLQRNKKEYFVFTSNIDAHFQRAGFDRDRIVECHGSIEHSQCSTPCHDGIANFDNVRVDIDETTMRAADPLPTCDRCGSVARPNILMFGDWNWLPERTEIQHKRYQRWLVENSETQILGIEFGAGTAVPTVRFECERRTDFLIRINPREPSVPSNAISLQLGALEAINELCTQ